MTYQDDLAEVRRNIAAHEASEKARIDRIVKEASKETEIWASERALLKRQEEEAQEAAIVERDRQKEQAQRDDAERSYLLAGGLPADFDAWYVVERQRLVSEKIANQRRSAELSMHRSF